MSWQSCMVVKSWVRCLQTLVPEAGDRKNNTCSDGVSPGMLQRNMQGFLPCNLNMYAQSLTNIYGIGQAYMWILPDLLQASFPSRSWPCAQVGHGSPWASGRSYLLKLNSSWILCKELVTTCISCALSRLDDYHSQAKFQNVASSGFVALAELCWLLVFTYTGCQSDAGKCAVCMIFKADTPFVCHANML